MCLAQGHKVVTTVRLKTAAPQSRVKHSTTEPLRSIFTLILLHDELCALHELNYNLKVVSVAIVI